MNVVSLTEKEILDRVNTQDWSIIEELYKRYFKVVCTKVIMKDGGSVEDAKDVFHEAVCSMMEKFQKDKNFIIKNLLSYLWQTCFNIWVKLKKDRRQTSSQDDSGLERLPDNSKVEKETKIEQEKKYAQMYDCIKTLSSECQKALKLFFFEKKKDIEISEVMNNSKDYIKSHRYRCMQKLRLCMGAKR